MKYLLVIALGLTLANCASGPYAMAPSPLGSTANSGFPDGTQYQGYPNESHDVN